MALVAASTGHLVLGTLHTPSAAKTVDRIIDVFPAEQQNKIRATLSEALKLAALTPGATIPPDVARQITLLFADWTAGRASAVPHADR